MCHLLSVMPSTYTPRNRTSNLRSGNTEWAENRQCPKPRLWCLRSIRREPAKASQQERRARLDGHLVYIGLAHTRGLVNEQPVKFGRRQFSTVTLRRTSPSCGRPHDDAARHSLGACFKNKGDKSWSIKALPCVGDRFKTSRQGTVHSWSYSALLNLPKPHHTQTNTVRCDPD